MNKKNDNDEIKDSGALQDATLKSQVNKLPQAQRVAQWGSFKLQRGIYSPARNLDSNFRS